MLLDARLDACGSCPGWSFERLNEDGRFDVDDVLRTLFFLLALLPPVPDSSRFSSRSVLGPPLLTLLSAVLIGLGALSVLIMLSASPILAAAGLFLTLWVVIGRGVGDIEYTITPEGLEMAATPLLHGSDDAPIKQTLPWKRVRSLEHKTDVSRAFREFRQVRLRVRGYPYRVWITDSENTPNFDRFCDALTARVEAVNRERIRSDESLISVKPDFYERPVARVVFAVFALMAVGLLGAAGVGMLSATNLIRLGLVILPGVLYMAYRLFRRRSGK